MPPENKSPSQLRRSCAAMDHHRQLAARDEVYRSNRRQIESFSALRRARARTHVIRIPTVVHILFHDASGDLPQDQIDSQIDVLNQDFRLRNPDRANIPTPFAPVAADLRVEFQLAVRDPSGRPSSGVTRTQTSLTEYVGTLEELDRLIKRDDTGKAPWPAKDYLNIWVCSLGSGLLGYAQFPGGPAATDGVVILNRAFGTRGLALDPKFNRGRTTTHEVGHYLNLLHIWGDDQGGCHGSDNVSDTPNQGGPNFDTPTFPVLSCGNGPHGDMFMNYMDYVDDAAMFMFTEGQSKRVDATLAGPRASLTRSRGLEPVETEALSLGPFDPRAIVTASAGEAGALADRIVFDGNAWIGKGDLSSETWPRTPGAGPVLPIGDFAHAFESDTSDALTFRRADGTFPPSRRPREILRVQPDRTVSFLSPGPADAPLAGDALVLEVGGEATRLMRRGEVFEVLSSGPDEVQLRRVVSPATRTL